MSLRARVILIGSVALLAVLLAYPSFFSEEQRLASDWISDQGLNLGLDLQGGIHWLLRIDSEKAMLDELRNLEKRLGESADRDGVAFSSIDVDEQAGEIVVRGAVERTFRKMVEENGFDTIEWSAEDGVLRASLTDEWKAFIIERGVRQGVDVLSRRIDDLGVREPVIAPQGKGRILVQMPGGEVDPRTARSMISKTTFLEFKKVLDAAPNEDLLGAKFPEGLPEQTEIVLAESNGVVSEALLVEAQAILTGAMLEDARLSFDRRGRALVTFTWDSEGTEIFREFTAQNVG